MHADILKIQMLDVITNPAASSRCCGVAYPAVFVCNDLEYFYTDTHHKVSAFVFYKLLFTVSRGRPYNVSDCELLGICDIK